MEQNWTGSRGAIFDEALGLVTQNTRRVIKILTGKIDNRDRRLALLAAKDVLDCHSRHVELATIEERLASLGCASTPST